MPIIKIDDKDYDTETFSDEAKAQLQSLQFVDQELAKLQAQAAVLQTARIAYAKALNDALGTELVFNGQCRSCIKAPQSLAERLQFESEWLHGLVLFRGLARGLF